MKANKLHRDQFCESNQVNHCVINSANQSRAIEDKMVNHEVRTTKKNVSFDFEIYSYQQLMMYLT